MASGSAGLKSTGPTLLMSGTPVPVLPADGPSLGDVKRAIPKHLFERSMLRSFMHVAADLVEAVVGIWLVLTFVEPIENPLLWVAGWAAFTFYQGATYTGLWVMAHECGHGGFSDSVLVNDTVGYILHTMLFVPYAAWQASHAKHHHYTNHMTKDEPFIPEILDEDAKPPTLSFLHTFTSAFIMLTVGWPLYLAINASGPPKDGLVSHYDPNTPLMSQGQAWKIYLGNAGLLAWTYALWKLSDIIGFSLVLRLYLLPLAITNMFLVSITFLQHSDMDVPHYDKTQWNWLRGAIATVDRSLGPLLDYKTHHIVDSHVCHHVFSSMPFYNAVEATPYIKEALGKYYVQRGNGFFDFVSAYWFNVGACNAVYGTSGILHFVLDQDDEPAAAMRMPRIETYPRE